MAKKVKKSETPSWEVDFYMDRLHRWLLLAKVPGEPSYEDQDRADLGLEPRKEEFGSEEFFQKRGLKPEWLKEETKRRTGSEEFTPLIPGELPPRFIPDKEWKRKARERIKEINREISEICTKHAHVKKQKGVSVFFKPMKGRIELYKRLGKKYRLAEEWEVQLRDLKYEKYWLECCIRGTNPEIERLEKEIEEFKKLRKQFAEEAMERNKGVIEIVKRRLKGVSPDVESSVFAAFFQLFVDYDPERRKLPRDKWIVDLLSRRTLSNLKRELPKKKRGELIEQLTEPEKLELLSPQEPSPEDTIRLEEFGRILSEREYKIVEKIYEGYTTEEIAKEIGVTRQRIRAVIDRILRKAKERGIGR